MPTTCANVGRLLLIVGAFVLARPVFAASETRDTVALQTELKFSGPAVTLRAPLGLRYRPGYAIPLEIRVNNLGAAFRGELLISQGGADDGLRCGVFEPLEFPAQTRVFSFPVIAPPVSADLNLLIREIDSSGAPGPLRFQCSLSRALKPLAPEARLVLTCGTPPNGVTLQESIKLSAKELPENAWAYESVDLVVLGDGSLREASAESKKALRQWLLGGGRLFVASNDAIAAAIAAELFPLSGATQIGADRAWWEKNAGLTQADILIEDNNRPVYVRLGLGFGNVVFLFPGTRSDDMTKLGMKVLNHPLLQPRREKLPDLRVQPDRFGGFAYGSVSPARRSEAVRWGALGALVLCVGLILGFTSRSRWVAAGWPLAISALLAVMLARWLPTRDLAISRIAIERQSLDGRAATRGEFTLLESFQETEPAAASSPVGGNLYPIYADTDELRAAQIDFLQAGDRLRAQSVPVLPRQSVMFFASSCEAVEKPPLEPTHVFEDAGHTMKLGARGNSSARLNDSRAVWVRADGSLAVLANLQQRFEIQSFDDWTSVLRKFDGKEDDATLKARAAALGWSSREALRSSVDTLIFWGRPRNTRAAPLCEIESVEADAEDVFEIFSAQVGVKQ